MHSGGEQTYAQDERSRRGIELAAGLLLGLGLAVAVLIVHPGLTVLTIIALGAAVLTFRWPFAGVLIYLFIMIFRPEELGLAPVVLHLGLVFALLCAVALVLSRALGHVEAPLGRSAADITLGLFLLAAGASVLGAVSRMGALDGWWTLLKLAFAYALIRYTATSIPRMRAVVMVIAAAALLTAVLSVLGFSSGEAFVGQGNVLRAIGPTSGESDPNSLANTMIAALAVLAPLAAAPGLWAVRWLFAATGALGVYVAALTGSRSGIVSLLAVVVLLAAVSRRRWQAVIALSIGGVLLWGVLPQDLKERYASTLSYQQVETYQTRKAAWEVAAHIFKKRPLTGCGITCYMVARVEEEDGVWLQPHSLYAQLISEVGLLGTAAFLAFIAAVFALVWRALRKIPQTEGSAAELRWVRALVIGLAIMFAALLVQGLAGHNLLRWNWYVGAALLVNAYQLIGRGQVASPSPP